jgi:hypothetical protein
MIPPCDGLFHQSSLALVSRSIYDNLDFSHVICTHVNCLSPYFLIWALVDTGVIPFLSILFFSCEIAFCSVSVYNAQNTLGNREILHDAKAAPFTW